MISLTTRSPLALLLQAVPLLRPEQALRDVVTPWTPSGVYEPRWEAHRAVEFRSAWRALAESTYAVAGS